MRSNVLYASVIAMILAFQVARAQPLRQPRLLTSNQTVEDTDSLERNFQGAENAVISPHKRPLSPSTATLVAIFPGVLFHGIGHFYARDPKTGFVLLGIDLASKGVLFYESLKGLSEGFREQSDAVLWVCVSVNAVAWLYDIGHAGAAANNYNARFRFSVKSRDGVPSMMLSLNLDG
ncbi:MAG: hypothetical protein WBP29_09735 [Candidatus Zixiibacteriota bacterium]